MLARRLYEKKKKKKMKTCKRTLKLFNVSFQRLAHNIAFDPLKEEKKRKEKAEATDTTLLLFVFVYITSRFILFSYLFNNALYTFEKIKLLWLKRLLGYVKQHFHTSDLIIHAVHVLFVWGNYCRAPNNTHTLDIHSIRTFVLQNTLQVEDQRP